MTTYTCPVCAYSGMPYPAEEGNICPCCGTEFGFDDGMGVTFRQLRDQWVAQHVPWFSPIDAPPRTWDGIQQLVLAEYEFTRPLWLVVASVQRTPVRFEGNYINSPSGFEGHYIDAHVQPAAA